MMHDRLSEFSCYPGVAHATGRTGIVVVVLMVPVRDAVSGDLDRLTDLLDQLGYPADLEEVRARLDAACDSRGGVLVATDGDTCVGFAAYQVVYFFEDGAPRCRVTAIAVDHAARGLGVGRALLAEVETRASRCGCITLEATSGHRPERAAAHRFYPALGFSDGGRRSAYYVKALLEHTSSDT